MENRSDAPPKPKSPLRRRLLRTAASVLGALAIGIQPTSPSAHAEGPRYSAPSPPGPDKEAILSELIPRDELLSDYGISVLDLPDSPDFVKLDFRNSAKEHPLFQKQATDKIPLYIVLLDGPYISPEFLTEEQKGKLPPEGIEKLEEACEFFIRERKKEYDSKKRIKLSRHHENLEFFQSQLDAGKITEDQYEVEIKDSAFRLLEPSEEAILEQARGLNLTPEVDRTENRYIFLPARNVEDKVIEHGSEKIVHKAPDERHGYPRPYQSFPDPSRFQTNPAEPMYPMWGGNTPSTNFRHEAQHVLGVPHPRTDHAVLAEMQEAHQEKLKGNNKKFWVVWQTKEGLTVSKSQNTTQAA